MSDKTQREQIVKYLLTGRSLTALEALQKFGCMRLGARIYELKQMGRDIKKYTARVGPEAKRVACYYLIRSAA
jgi:cell division protein FtsB